LTHGGRDSNCGGVSRTIADSSRSFPRDTHLRETALHALHAFLARSVPRMAELMSSDPRTRPVA
jgi:hypothetical protein